MAAFRLPSGCVKEIERICSAFLWSGPELNGRKAKIAWEDICRMKQEGGLGLRPLKEVNQVSYLKLIWRILSAKSLWVNWIKVYLIRKGSFWTVKENTQSGSWMWMKILKHREIAKQFYRVKVNNGRRTSFWNEMWNSLGCLKDVAGEGSHIDMGILSNASVEDSLNHRRRKHRVQILNRIEMEIEEFRRNWNQNDDVSLWKNDKGIYKREFSKKSTWLCIRERHQLYHWHQAIWFKHVTPKFSVVTWIAMRGRLATGDRMQHWNANTDVSCVLCQDPLETSSHLFFECSYSRQIWEKLTKGIFKDQYTADWERIVSLLVGSSSWSRVQMFTMRYIFQSTVHTIWRERNRRRHGEAAITAEILIRRLDKNMRNQFSVIQRRGDKEYREGMTFWFNTRQH